MNSSRTSARPLALGLALGLGLASSVLGAAVPASARTAAGPSASAGTPVARYDGSGDEAANNKAFFEAVLKSVAAKRAAQPDAQAVTITYDDSRAPSFRSQIASAASIWNSSESNVKLKEASSGADFSYYEGNDQRGSYASTNGHGSGYIFIDYTQSRQYDSVRIVAHETGHVLGLQDDYSGPCSELMSGGGAGPSCTNRYPDTAERSRVDQLWGTGAAQAPSGTQQAPSSTGNQTGGQQSTVPQVPTLIPGQGQVRLILGLPWG
ncbi:snapalysin [Streptomyces sp. NPDC008092]|uniref:snapalysin n=1 Tax=Streptomyces sp. NPDC008092 TaxID=3364808 RepID=UPI0036F131F5